jgi:hypothetical protein
MAFLTEAYLDKQSHSHCISGLTVVLKTTFTDTKSLFDMVISTETVTSTSLVVPLWIKGREEFWAFGRCCDGEERRRGSPITNSSGYDLSDFIFTKGLRKGFTLAKQIQTGQVQPL